MNQKIPVIVIFDIGKTNKKVLLFDDHYRVVLADSATFKEAADEDGFPCEDVEALTEWVKDSFQLLLHKEQFEIRAVNFSAYGASLVFLDDTLRTIPPLYNYLKPYPPGIKKKFYAENGDERVIARETASPVLGSLNSGMQLYRLKYKKPEMFEKIKYALHLPQYLSFILSSEVNADITSIGSHTMLWDFKINSYHKWVIREGIIKKLPPNLACTEIAREIEGKILVGAGLHDSSAALIPYLISFTEPFILLSTGTWCISLNPFNQTELTDDELDRDCLCYLTHGGKPVKASRLLAGQEHETHARALSLFFNKPFNYFESVACDRNLLRKVRTSRISQDRVEGQSTAGKMKSWKRRPDDFQSYEEAYHYLMADIMDQQVRSTSLVLKGTKIRRIFVDGGFSKNPIYMHLLAEAFPSIEVYGASVPQASALGSALVIHSHWNTKNLPDNIIDLKLYSVQNGAAIL